MKIMRIAALVLALMLTLCAVTCAETRPTTEAETETIYYATPQGRCYHTLINCAGMQGASPIGEDVALDSGKLPCPLCNIRYAGPLANYAASLS